MINALPETSAMLLITVGLILWDVFLAADKEPGNTISEVIQQASKRWWIIAYGWGVLAGHFFLTSPVESLPVWTVPISLTAAGIGGLVFGATRKLIVPRWLALIVGAVHGWLLWGTS